MVLSQVSGLILAGGYSSRMGKEKTELPFRGKTLLEHQIQKLRSLGLSKVYVCGYEKPVMGATLIPDIYPHRGPLSGIHAGLHAVETLAALVLAVDIPLVPEDFLRELIAFHEKGITIATLEGKREPLLGVYDASLSPLCEELLFGEDRSVRSLLSKVSLHCLPYEGDPALLMNCNKPEDYEKVLNFPA